MVDIGIADNTDTLLSGFIIAIAITFVILSIVLIFCYYKLFEKNGEKGWKAIIPIYNMYILIKIADMNPFSILLLLVPIVNLFVLALLSVNLANKYNKGALFAVGLLFLPIIYYPILAFADKDIETKEVAQPTTESSDKEPLIKEEQEAFENTDLKEIQTISSKTNTNLEKRVSTITPDKVEKSIVDEENNQSNAIENISTKEKDTFDSEDALPEFREILKVNDYKPKEEKNNTKEEVQTTTLDEILETGYKQDTVEMEKDAISPIEEVEDLNKAADNVLKSMKIINKEKAIKEKQEALEESTVCTSCGSIIPRFAKKCLLCGADRKK